MVDCMERENAIKQLNSGFRMLNLNRLIIVILIVLTVMFISVSFILFTEKRHIAMALLILGGGLFCLLLYWTFDIIPRLRYMRNMIKIFINFLKKSEKKVSVNTFKIKSFGKIYVDMNFTYHSRHGNFDFQLKYNPGELEFPSGGPGIIENVLITTTWNFPATLFLNMDFLYSDDVNMMKFIKQFETIFKKGHITIIGQTLKGSLTTILYLSPKDHEIKKGLTFLRLALTTLASILIMSNKIEPEIFPTFYPSPPDAHLFMDLKYYKFRKISFCPKCKKIFRIWKKNDTCSKCNMLLIPMLVEIKYFDSPITAGKKKLLQMTKKVK